VNAELCRLGYTPREADFLEVAALQSGYFLRRQFNAHIERECGALGQRFIDRALALGHIGPLPGFGRQHLYHVCSRALYEEIGEPDNRNRRLHAPETVRHRLMTLDFVLARRAENWLLKQQARGAALARLMAQNTLPSDATLVAQMLTDRQPMSTDTTGLRLAFVDEGLRSFSKWERFLKQRRPLLRADGTSAVVYAACSPARFHGAGSVFRRVAGEGSGEGGIDRDRLKGYFAARHLFEERRFENFDKARLDRLREDQRTFAGDTFETLYRSWRHAGDAALAGCTAPAARFETHQLGVAYAWLSPIRFQERKVLCGPDSSTGKESS